MTPDTIKRLKREAVERYESALADAKQQARRLELHHGDHEQG